MNRSPWLWACTSCAYCGYDMLNRGPTINAKQGKKTYVITHCSTSPQGSKSFPNGKQNYNFTEHFLQKTATLCVPEKQ